MYILKVPGMSECALRGRLNIIGNKRFSLRPFDFRFPGNTLSRRKTNSSTARGFENVGKRKLLEKTRLLVTLRRVNRGDYSAVWNEVVFIKRPVFFPHRFSVLPAPSLSYKHNTGPPRVCFRREREPHSLSWRLRVGIHAYAHVRTRHETTTTTDGIPSCRGGISAECEEPAKNKAMGRGGGGGGAARRRGPTTPGCRLQV